MNRIEIIVAVDQAGGFAKDGKIPWNSSTDLKHFKETTKGHICIMGRKTYEDMREMRKARDRAKGIKRTLIKEILPERESFVLSRKPKYKAPGAKVMPNLRETVQSIPEDDERRIFVLGGEKLFIEAIQWASKVHITLMRDYYNCDRFFPVHLLNMGGDFELTTGHSDDDLFFLTYERVGLTSNDETTSSSGQQGWRVIFR